MTKDERDELLRDASALAYQAIRFSGLYRELSGAEWDEVADEFGKGVIHYLEARCHTRLAILTDRKESTNAD